MDELTDQAQSYRAVHRLAEKVWDRDLEVEALLTLAELAGEPPAEGPRLAAGGLMTRAPLNLERITVNLTDVVNRALAVYLVVLDVMESKQTNHLMVVQPDGTKERVHFL